MDFTNKVVLITGSSRGIGRAAAQQFAEKGAQVAIHYNSNRQAAEDTLSMLPGGPHMIVQADISDPKQIAAMVKMAVSTLSRIDILVNNAAIYEDHPLADVSYEQWQAFVGDSKCHVLCGAADD